MSHFTGVQYGREEEALSVLGVRYVGTCRIEWVSDATGVRRVRGLSGDRVSHLDE